MRELELTDDGPDGTVFRDVIMLALLGFVTIVILILPHLNPPGQTEAGALPPGNLVVSARWPDLIDADVDLWVQAPGDRPVGYSNLGGRVFNLLRDDLGKKQDLDGANFEVAYSRGLPPGEYTINLHLYRDRTGSLPLSVIVEVSLKNSRDTPVRRILVREAKLTRVGEEITVVRFTLDATGQLMPATVNELPRPLRNTGS
jgi:hypothetical protein